MAAQARGPEDRRHETTRAEGSRLLKNWQSSLERVQGRDGSDVKGMVGAGRVGSDRDGSLQVPVMPYNRIRGTGTQGCD